jgi:hypothetical protein
MLSHHLRPVVDFCRRTHSCRLAKSNDLLIRHGPLQSSSPLMIDDRHPKPRPTPANFCQSRYYLRQSYREGRTRRRCLSSSQSKGRGRLYCICDGGRSDSQRYVAGWPAGCALVALESSQPLLSWLFILRLADTPVIFSWPCKRGGADVIELGIPHTPTIPQADGATIQHPNQVWQSKRVT